MALFDHLFGKKELPKIEEVVKEALENLDLSDDTETSFREADEGPQEEADIKRFEESEVEEKEIQDTVVRKVGF